MTLSKTVGLSEVICEMGVHLPYLSIELSWGSHEIIAVLILSDVNLFFKKTNILLCIFNYILFIVFLAFQENK